MNASEPNAPEKLRRLPSMSAMTCSGRVNCRKRPFAQSNRPASTITPPMALPCPVMPLVVECTTMSAPNSIGRSRYGVGTVLSRISASPCRCARSASGRISVMAVFGLATVSAKMARVAGPIRDSISCRSLMSLTKSAWMPNCGRKSPSASTDAPYRFVGAMMRPPPSPAHISAYDTAAMPDDTATAPTPPSRAASRRSSASSVGLATLEYSNPDISPAARSRPRAAFSKSKAAEA